MYILETNSFKYYLGERLLFKLPALKLHTKSRIGLIGLNGSGKTTLLELLAGIRPIPAAAKIITSPSATSRWTWTRATTWAMGCAMSFGIGASLRRQPGPW